MTPRSPIATQEGRSSRRRSLRGKSPIAIDLWVVLGVMLGFGGLELLAFQIDDPGAPVVAPAIGFTILIYAYPFFRQRPLDVFAPPVYTSLGPLLMLTTTVAYWFVNGSLELRWIENLSSEERTDLILEALFALSIGQIAYYIGYYQLGLGKRLARFFPKVSAVSWNGRALLAISVVIFGVSFLGYYAFQQRLGIALDDPSAIGEGRNITHRDIPESTWMTRTILAAFIPLFFYLTKVASVRSRVNLILVSLGLLVVAVLIGRTGGRGLFMGPLVACVVVYHYLARRVHASLIIALMVCAILFSNVYGEYRQQLRYGYEPTLQETTEAAGTGITDVLASFARERSQFFVYTLMLYEFPRNHDHLLGETYAELAVVLVPRWIWPNKNAFYEWRENDLVRRLRGAPVPTPFVGVMYVNFSYAGIVFGCLFWGIFHRSQYEWLMASQRDRGTVLLYAMLLVFVAPSLLALSVTLQFVLPVYLTLKVIRLGRAKGGPDAPGMAARAVPKLKA